MIRWYRCCRLIEESELGNLPGTDDELISPGFCYSSVSTLLVFQIDGNGILGQYHEMVAQIPVEHHEHRAQAIIVGGVKPVFGFPFEQLDVGEIECFTKPVMLDFDFDVRYVGIRIPVKYMEIDGKLVFWLN